MGTTVTHLSEHAGKSDRLNIRTTADDKLLIESAARITRLSTSEFVMQAALAAAAQIVAEQTRFSLPPEQWDAFVAALDRPARVIPELECALAKPSPFRER